MSASLPRPIRVDLHCHSVASNEADEAVLNAIGCPESYSAPQEVYAQAKRRNMDFVTITDHDSLEGVHQLSSHPDVLVGEELTCYFPEDHCKIHLLVWGITQAQHDAMQAVAQDIYAVAEIVERERIAHSVAHPLYRQNDRLERIHLEKLALMFKGFECLNGAHSVLHREAFEPFVDALTPGRIEELAAKHGMAARWPEPWHKARTAGSDDHGLFNVGRTWTEFPPETSTQAAILDCLREGRCRPGGEAGSSLKLAHNFFSVGVRYYTRQVQSPADANCPSSVLMQVLVGDRRRPSKRAMVGMAVRSVGRNVRQRIGRAFSRRHPQPPRGGADLFMNLLGTSIRKRMREQPELCEALNYGTAPLAEHESMFNLVSGMNRDIAGGIAAAVERGLGEGSIAPLFDALSAVAAHQFALLPYYFALFHQNRERHLFGRLTGADRAGDVRPLRVAAFTDTLDEVNGVARCIRDMARQTTAAGRSMTVHTCTAGAPSDAPWRKNFSPLFSRPLPRYPEQKLVLPPVLEILEWADRQQFDAVHIHTPGPMGLCGLLVAKMLRVPVLATYHTDFPAYVDRLTGDHRLTVASADYMRWFYGQADVVLARSREYQDTLRDMGIAEHKLVTPPPSVDTDAFNPRHRDLDCWSRLGVKQPHRLFYCGRVSREKNLDLLVDAFKQLCKVRSDTALVIAGDGPYREKMQKELAGLPVYFLGYRNDASLAPLYATSDLFVFPSRTDTLGQVVMEAQASGLPVLVSSDGGPKEVMDDGLTGLVLSPTDAGEWARAIDGLLSDTPRRLRMSRTAPHRVARFSLQNTAESSWDLYVKAAQRSREEAEQSLPTSATRAAETATTSAATSIL
jgi:glycosyltransferase involved in cell wall biosynthesis/predicted metal-dependent phosphoesterase TrpH